ncbi:unnamed protein product [Prorocentrum cordatum]|uniref:Uncharacterized protein n=1 Tax=Prorocentrum cordatum TaxID=2364126 RepID=A0ABN9WCV1_9DINO|nr:unnamed protein product [Polarella glacialis]
MELWLKRESHDVGGHGPRAPPLAGVPKNASGGPEGNGALRETSGDLATRLAAVSRHALAEWPVARCHVGLLGDCAPAADGGLEGNQGRTIITAVPAPRERRPAVPPSRLCRGVGRSRGGGATPPSPRASVRSRGRRQPRAWARTGGGRWLQTSANRGAFSGPSRRPSGP